MKNSDLIELAVNSLYGITILQLQRKDLGTIERKNLEKQLTDCKEFLNPQKKSDYPEHDKLSNVQEESQLIGEFLDTLKDKGYFLAEWVNTIDEEDEDRTITRFTGVTKPINTILAEYYEVDLNKLETEKKQMLDAIRNTNKK